MLWFLAEHRMVLERQIAVLLDQPVIKVAERIGELEGGRYLTRFVGWGGARCCRIAKPGLTAVGSELRAPSENQGAYRHDVGTAWLWVLAQRGDFGPLVEVMGERRLRAEDLAVPERPYSVRLGGYDGKGKGDRHYPDLLLIDPLGRRMALELELSTKGLARRETILAGYGADRRLEGVVYFVERTRNGRGIAQRIQSAAGHMGISDRIHVRTVPPIQVDGSQAPSSGRAARARSPSPEATR